MNTKITPTLQRALNSDWDKLAPAVRRHYETGVDVDNGVARLELKGVMDEIQVRGIGKIVALLSRPFQALVPCSGAKVKSEVSNWADSDGDAMHWRRLFYYPGRKPLVFASRMECAGDHEIIEFVNGGFGLRLRLEVNQGALVFIGLHYVAKVGPWLIKIPNWVLAGDAHTIETEVDEDTIRVEFEIVHPLWGKTIGYKGTFSMN